MRDADADLDGGTRPKPIGRSSSTRRSSERTIRFDEDEESIRRYAEEFLVNWMALAVNNAKRKIVAEALEQVANIGNVTEIDQAIINVISRWNFSESPEKGSKLP